MQLTQPLIENGGPGANRPIIRQAQLPIRISSLAVLSGIEFAHNIFGQDNETIINRYMDATQPDHIRFVFDMSAGAGRVQEPRFWNTEILALAALKRDPTDSHALTLSRSSFTIHHAIAEILGSRENFARAEIGIQWSLSSNLLSDLIRANALKQTGARLMRPDLETFLLKRWIGNRQNA